ncbi:hypothetical protein RUM43_014614 [Polyplax serrata]|uniref:Malate dehydrogenase n=1 Tax=Polyplax serrata TaxID=468196 RepID=A0AAN8S6S9_POLSC
MASVGYAKGVVPLNEAKRFLKDCLMAVDTSQETAEQLAEVLVAADYRGHYSHGLNRLEIYLNDIKGKVCNQNARPKILKETPATAWVDGQNGLGPVVGNFCIDLAIQKAKKCGVGWVAAKNSNHYGIAGWYSKKAADCGLIGMSFTNTSPFLCPTRAKEAALGTNPISVAAPGKAGDSFVLDMATTAVAVGKIEMQHRKGESIPEGWAADENGRLTTDAAVAQAARRLMPVGGAELTSGYKGYGLCQLVEVFCGVLAGAQYGPHIRKWGATDRPANLGQCFVAVDPACFAPGFHDRVSDLNDRLRNLEPAEEGKPVLVAGDPERIRMKLVDSEGGIRYHVNQIKAANEIAQNLNVTPLKLEKSLTG